MPSVIRLRRCILQRAGGCSRSPPKRRRSRCAGDAEFGVRAASRDERLLERHLLRELQLCLEAIRAVACYANYSSASKPSAPPRVTRITAADPEVIYSVKF